MSWAAGAQLLAINFHTMQQGMQFNLGKFADNGGCGYVLKPHMISDVAPEAAYTISVNPGMGCASPQLPPPVVVVVA
jgi:hypothetical protein